MHDAPHDDIPISDRTLDALRTTASMLGVVPDLGAVVRIGDDVLLEVRRSPLGDDVSHRVLPPCAFRGAVTGAHRLRRSGQRVGMHGVPSSLEPSIDWGLAGPGRMLPGRIVRAERDGRWWHVVPVAVSEAVVQSLVADGPDRVERVGRLVDDDLDVVLLHVISPKDDEAGSVDAVSELVSAITAIGIIDLEHRLAAGADVVRPPRGAAGGTSSRHRGR